MMSLHCLVVKTKWAAPAKKLGRAPDVRYSAPMFGKLNLNFAFVRKKRAVVTPQGYLKSRDSGTFRVADVRKRKGKNNLITLVSPAVSRSPSPAISGIVPRW